MVAAAFSYLRVYSLNEAVQALSDRGEDARLLAGGQSLVPMLNLRLAMPSVLIDINAADSREPFVDDGCLVLPALTRHAQLMASPMIQGAAPMLSAAASHVGNVRVRNRGTIGGSLAHADPTAEISCAALALDATIAVLGPQGERLIPAGEFFTGYLSTRLEPDEVISELRVPVRGPQRGWSFIEVARRAADFAVVAVAASVEVDPGGVVRDARVALACVADRAVLADPQAIASLAGTAPTGARLADVGRAAAEAVSPEDDVHASGGYRKRLVAVLTRRALAEAITRAHQGRGAADPDQRGRISVRGRIPVNTTENRASYPAPAAGRGARQDRRLAGALTKVLVNLQVNGVSRDVWVSPSDLLLDVLHDVLGLAEVRYGCGEGVCGTCTVLLDGEPASACLTLAVQAQGRAVTTLSGLIGEDGSLHPLQEAFLRLGGSQCGFCTPGVILTACSLARRVPAPSREQIRYELVGSLCRCTGYTKIVDSIESCVSGLGTQPPGEAEAGVTGTGDRAGTGEAPGAGMREADWPGEAR